MSFLPLSSTSKLWSVLIQTNVLAVLGRTSVIALSREQRARCAAESGRGIESDFAVRVGTTAKSLSSAATKLDHVKIICEENESVGGVSAGSVLAGDFDKETEVAFRAFTGAQTVLREKATGDSSEEYMQALQERNRRPDAL
eukprot:PhM_4_TR9831/c0_g1_i1/m.13470